MGLLKPITQPTQFETGYSNIQNVRGLSFENGTGSGVVTLGMYRDAAARKDGAQPVPQSVRVKLTESEAGLLKKTLYPAIKRASVLGVTLEDATDHTEASDPDLTGLVDQLKDWEVKILLARVEGEMTERELEPLTQAEIDAYFAAVEGSE